MNNTKTEFVIELLHKYGTYKDNLYNNVYLVTCFYNDEGEPVSVTSDIKCPLNKFLEMTACLDFASARETVLNRKVISYSFDRFGRLSSLIVDTDED